MRLKNMHMSILKQNNVLKHTLSMQMVYLVTQQAGMCEK